MAKMEYTLQCSEFLLGYQIKVEIDHSSKTDSGIKIMVEFWAGWERQLRINNGNYTDTFLQMLGAAIYNNAFGKNYNLKGVIGIFNDREGWCKMDGSNGIKITMADIPEPEWDDIEIIEGKEIN